MNNLHGGAKKKNPSKIGFAPIRDMLNSAETLKLLSDDSLYGFIFELTVDTGYSEYTTIYDDPITSFILKIVVTSENKQHILPEYKSKNKQSESVSNLVNESRVQQDIWLQSVQYGDPEICPDVLDVFFFDYQNSKHLIRLFETLTLDFHITSMLRYLKNDIFNNPKDPYGYGIGLIVMPKVTNSITVDSYSHSPQYPEKLTELFSNIIAQIIRLFIVNGIIHLDLHTDNILINPSTLYCEIIDFGLILQLQPKQYHSYRSQYNELNNDAQKSKFMKDTLNHISVVEVGELQRQFPQKQIVSNFKWFIDYSNENESIYSLAYQKLFEFMPPVQLIPPSKKRKQESTTKAMPIGKSNKRGKNIPKIDSNYTFDPTKVNTIIPFISDEHRETKITSLEVRQKQKKAQEEIEKQRIFDENQRRWIETQPKWDETQSKLSEKDINPWACKNDDNKSDGWGCTVMGGKIKTRRGKITKKKHIKKKNKTWKKHTQKQRQK